MKKLKSTKMTATTIVLLITATTTALIAGLFYAWSCSVTLGLARVSDENYIGAMQAINRAIQNAIFFISFLGTVALLPLSTYLNYNTSHSTRFLLLLAATVIYLIGVFGITVFGNIPLNNALDAFNLKSASMVDISAARIRFEKPWNSLNTIRTIASTISLILVIMACLTESSVVETH